MTESSIAPAVLHWPAPRAAYLHVPFCRHRCGYCNFSVVAGRDDLINRFLAAIDRELSVDPTLNQGNSHPDGFDTIFVGGGTPTHLSDDQVRRFFRIIERRLPKSADCELTFEANPEDITPDKLRLLRDHGVNRISLGVQSFQEAKIGALQRGHSGRQAVEAIKQASDVIGNVSIDLMFAAPNESLADWECDLSIALSLPVVHLSAYSLTIEKGTSFFARHVRGDLVKPDDDVEVRMYEATAGLTAAAGLDRYEISNYARPGSQCRHNLAYWRGQPWLAAGPGAARFVGGFREVNHRSTTTYLKRIEAGQSPTAESEMIDSMEYARELLAFGVRTIEGVDLRDVRRRSTIDVDRLFGDSVTRLVEQGWIRRSEDRLALTQRGLMFADAVASEFLG